MYLTGNFCSCLVHFFHTGHGTFCAGPYYLNHCFCTDNLCMLGKAVPGLDTEVSLIELDAVSADAVFR